LRLFGIFGNRAEPDMDANILHVDTPISNGRYRQVYIHPQDETKLIKVELPIERALQHKSVSNLTKARRALRALISGSYVLTGHEREILGIAELRRKAISDHHFFVKYYGEVQTNIGRGLIFQRITNFDQGIIYKLSDYLNENKYIQDEHLRYAVESYFDLLLKNRIYIYGGESENIGIIRDGSGNLSVKTFDFKLYTNKAIIKIGSRGRYAKINIEIQRRKALGI
jgi:hypothetical protein